MILCNRDQLNICNRLAGCEPVIVTFYSSGVFWVAEQDEPFVAAAPGKLQVFSDKKTGGFAFDSLAAVALAVINSRSGAFSKQRSQSFIDRGTGGPGSGAMSPRRSPLWSAHEEQTHRFLGNPRTTGVKPRCIASSWDRTPDLPKEAKFNYQGRRSIVKWCGSNNHDMTIWEAYRRAAYYAFIRPGNSPSRLLYGSVFHGGFMYIVEELHIPHKALERSSIYWIITHWTGSSYFIQYSSERSSVYWIIIMRFCVLPHADSIDRTTKHEIFWHVIDLICRVHGLNGLLDLYVVVSGVRANCPPKSKVQTGLMIRRQTNDKIPNFHQRSTLWRKCTTFRKLRQIHAYMIINGFNASKFNLRELIYVSALVIPSGISYAHQLFDQITQPDLFMWNTMLRGSAQSPNPAKTVSLYTQMERRDIQPDRYTFPFVLKACTKLSWPITGSTVHGKITKHGFDDNTFAKNTLIYFHANVGNINIARALFDSSATKQVVAWSALTAGYARRGNLTMARKVFDEMPEKDLISWNVMITGYAKMKQMDSAKTLFTQVPNPDVVTWNAMIAGYVSSGMHTHALDMFDEMSHSGEQPDEVTMLSLVTACTNTNDLEIGERIHHSVLKLGGGQLSILLGNALIDMYAKCGQIKKALNIFNNMKEKVVTTWNSIIGGLAFHGHSSNAINIFEKMRKLKITPNDITFVGVLVACSHAGKVQEGKKYFHLMKKSYNINPNIKHYGCMVDILGRAGLLNEAFEFVKRMEIEPNDIIWRTLLGACRVHNNVELGKIANAELLKLRCGESGDYVLLSNIYASQGEWDGALRLRKAMDDKGVRKEAASSLVDTNDKTCYGVQQYQKIDHS
ncbi:hypothetical protein LXL04_006310 [Taraxacum kok-saghyz]